METLIFSALLGLAAGSVFTYGALFVFKKIGWLDFPERYGLTRDRLPYPGGVVLWILLMLGLWWQPDFRPLIWPVLLLGLVSWYDDRRPLSAWFRLLTHVWLALWVVLQGIVIYYVSNPFADTNFALAEAFPALAIGLTIAWIVAIQNAMNWFDGLPGLNVGISGVGFLTLGLLGVVKPELWFDPNHYSLTLINFYAAGICGGAFWFYLKGKIVLGDSGSQVLGWLLAVMAVFSGAKIATTLMVLSLPLLDMAWVIFRRIFLQRQSPFKGDLFHLHHLLATRAQAQNVTLALVGCSFLLGLAAVFTPADYKLLGLSIVALFIIGLNGWLWHERKI